LRYFSSIPSFLRAFIMKWCWILSKTFSASIEMEKWKREKNEKNIFLNTYIYIFKCHLLIYFSVLGTKFRPHT
jgi:hypothetical protein